MVRVLPELTCLVGLACIRLLAQATPDGSALGVLALEALKELGSIAAVLGYAWYVTTKAMPAKDQQIERIFQQFLAGLETERKHYDEQVEKIVGELKQEREDNRTVQRSMEAALRDMVRGCTHAQRAYVSSPYPRQEKE